MVELNELRYGDNEIILDNNVVRSAILPQKTRELTRNIRVQGGSVVEGAVYGESIQIYAGKTEFKGAVYANNELYISSDVADKVVFEKASASNDTISALVNNGNVQFWSDINAKEIKLKNCYVGGSIYGQNVFMENCVVLGGVFAVKNATISNSVVGTFNASEVELAGVNYLLYPAGFSVAPLTRLPGAELHSLALAHLGAIYKGEPEAQNTGRIQIDLENDHQRTVLNGNDDSMTIVNSYSAAGRVLVADMTDLEKLENHFLIGAGALGTQVLKAYSLNLQQGGSSKPLTVDNISEFFFSILKGVLQIRELSGEVSFAEIKRNLQ